MPTQPRRVIRYGNDICQEIALPTGGTFVVTYWDVWFAIVLVAALAGDWDKLADQLSREVKTSFSFRRYANEGYLCHLQLLRQALDEAGLSVQDILSSVEPNLLKPSAWSARCRPLSSTRKRMHPTLNGARCIERFSR